MNERLLLKGRLTDLNRKYKDLEIKADAYISIIREIIDPYAGDFLDFDMDKFLVIANDFYQLWRQAKDMKAQITKVEQALNG